MASAWRHVMKVKEQFASIASSRRPSIYPELGLVPCSLSVVVARPKRDYLSSIGRIQGEDTVLSRLLMLFWFLESSARSYQQAQS